MEPNLLEELLDWVRSHYYGKYRGCVTDNADATQRGRLKVRVPAVLADHEVWAMPCVPYAGDGVGFYSLPEPGAGVWVEFEGGDPSFPIWVGGFWADNELPDEADAAIKTWKTEQLQVRIDDTADELKVETTGGSTLTVADAITSDTATATHTVGSEGVVSEAGATKAEVTTTAFKVNNGALEVM
ncbi:phage baseplate assembly protein V [Halomicronema sp. CCY15110]|uniref:phage baseplate assembly protein V n=1 Tax=Halomicronema sp. CCY15110 TaxID=2767773 RepID=UPI0019527916|nr:phage baseplate assembly protein V [Halomicronema sp. CCY15110]